MTSAGNNTNAYRGRKAMLILFLCLLIIIIFILFRKLRHERVQIEKRRRNDALEPLRTRLQQLDPSIRPGSSFRDSDENNGSSKKKNRGSSTKILPSIGRNGHKRGGNSPPNYREVMEAVHKLQKERKEMPDPYQANLKVPADKASLYICDVCD